MLNPVTGEVVNFTAILDSGAAISVAPLDAVHEIRLAPADSTEVRGFEGAPQRVPVFSSTWVIEGYAFLGVEHVTTEGAIGLIGRDMLHHSILTLDGKAGQFTLVDP